MTRRVEGFKIVGCVDGEYYAIMSVFEHSNDLFGVTGCIVRPVFEKEYEWASDPENIAERYFDVWMETYSCPDCPDCEGYPDDDKGCERCDTPSLIDWVNKALCIDGVEHLMFDSSFCCDAERAFTDLGIEFETTDCSGCGRIFNHGSPTVFDQVIDRAAYAAALEYEAGNSDFEKAAYAIFGSVEG